ncbi:unnamed protein product [Phytophthora fragariaefolia]|uniref:Unnamed protein product n=1 Tax=Phytophthora fragariaefolia TaxID=1490495 RepID=A0A9W6UEL3_9STRA|nr:unnamed protein product [Phytophthora fragariaefolia]
MMYGTPPNVSKLPVWGSVCCAHIHAALRNDKKLSARFVKCRFLGMSEETKGYRLWDIYNNKHIQSRDVLFDRTNIATLVQRAFGETDEALTIESAARELPAAKEADALATESTEAVEAGELEEGPTSAVGAEEPTQTSNPAVGAMKRRQIIGLSVLPGNVRAQRCARHSKPTPRSLKDALSGSYREQWKQALELEYDSLIDNGMWRLVRLPPGRKALPCHWVLVVKYNAGGTVERFNARLVAQGKHQEFGVDCDKVYAPVTRFESLRLVLAIETILDCYIHQMDVHTTFLNGTMEGEQKFYMEATSRICETRS